jgi:hypothetical protein
VTNAATEPNIHSVTAGYLLLNPPAGASIDTNGVFTWTPGQTQSPGTNLITTVVTNTNPYDLVNPHLSATNSFTVIVREVNQSPVLPSIPPQIVNEFSLLIVTNTATEPNIHALTAGYLLLNPPLGASIDANGVITWTPAEGQGPSTNILTTVVTNTDALDTVNSHLSATNSFTVVVNEINRPPVLGSLTNWTVNPGQTISFTATATDPDIPSETLTFSLVSPPAGATIGASSGQFTWRPSITQANTTNVVQIQVTDSNPAAVNSQHLSDTKSFTAVINSLAPVILTPLPAAGGKFQMQINGTVGPDYTILGSTNLSAWSSITTTNPAATPFRFTDPSTGAIRYRFYRVLLGP